MVYIPADYYYSVKEISVILGVAEGTIRQYLNRHPRLPYVYKNDSNILISNFGVQALSSVFGVDNENIDERYREYLRCFYGKEVSL